MPWRSTQPSPRANAGAAAHAPVAGEGLATAASARDAMLLRTHTAFAPWHIVRADDKRLARLNLFRDILSRLDYPGKKNKLLQPDPAIVFEFSPDCIAAKQLAR